MDKKIDREEEGEVREGKRKGEGGWGKERKEERRSGRFHSSLALSPPCPARARQERRGKAKSRLPHSRADLAFSKELDWSNRGDREGGLERTTDTAGREGATTRGERTAWRTGRTSCARWWTTGTSTFGFETVWFEDGMDPVCVARKGRSLSLKARDGLTPEHEHVPI